MAATAQATLAGISVGHHAVRAAFALNKEATKAASATAVANIFSSAPVADIQLLANTGGSVGRGPYGDGSYDQAHYGSGLGSQGPYVGGSGGQGRFAGGQGCFAGGLGGQGIYGVGGGAQGSYHGGEGVHAPQRQW